MFAGGMVCERGKHGAAHIPRQYLVRFLLNSSENPDFIIQQIVNYHMSIDIFCP